MSDILNIYCDESCHLMNDGFNSMVLGSLIIPYDKVKEVSEKIKCYKVLHGMDVHNELKWTKVSNNKIEFYMDIINLFFSDKDIRFRCVVVPDKSKLKHDIFGRTHDNFYYVMYYYGLKFVLNPKNKYNIYFDYKDTCQYDELRKLKTYLQKDTSIPESSLKLQPVLSFESQLIQLCDLLTGAVSYRNRGLCESDAKTSIVEMIEKETKQSLSKISLVKEEKFNVFVWTPRDCKDQDA